MNQAVDPALIFIDQDLKSKEEIVAFLADQAQTQGFVMDAKQYVQAVFDREAEISTALGYDLAIPHGKTNTVKEPFMMFLRLKEPIQWNEDKNSIVKMVFMLGIPAMAAEKSHLKMLSTIARKLMHDDFHNQMLEETNPQKIINYYQIFNRKGKIDNENRRCSSLSHWCGTYIYGCRKYRKSL